MHTHACARACISMRTGSSTAAAHSAHCRRPLHTHSNSAAQLPGWLGQPHDRDQPDGDACAAYLDVALGEGRLSLILTAGALVIDIPAAGGSGAARLPATCRQDLPAKLHRLQHRAHPTHPADPGDFSGTSEAHYILANLRHPAAKPRASSVCGSVFHGSLMGQPVVVATTGASPTGWGHPRGHQ